MKQKLSCSFGTFSVLPVPCLDRCTCFYSTMDAANTVDCSHNNMTKLPTEVLPQTEQLIMARNNMQTLRSMAKNLSQVKHFDLHDCHLKKISEKTMTALLAGAMKVNLSGNKLQKLPSVLATENFTTKLWLANNPFECTCDMMPMRDWLVNTTNVMDKQNITCVGGKWKGRLNNFQLLQVGMRKKTVCVIVCLPGTAILNLDRTKMGCIAFPIWIGIVVGSVTVLLITIVVIINKKWNALKFFLFMNFDILVNDDEPENLDDMEFDAFVTYRYILLL